MTLSHSRELAHFRLSSSDKELIEGREIARQLRLASIFLPPFICLFSHLRKFSPERRWFAYCI